MFISSRNGDERLDAARFEKLLKDRRFDDEALAYGNIDRRWLNLAEQFWGEFVGDAAARKTLTQNAKVRSYQLNSVLGAPWPLILNVGAESADSLKKTMSDQLQSYFRQRLTETEKLRQFAAFYPREKKVWGPHEDADSWDRQDWLFCEIDRHLRTFAEDLVSQAIQPSSADDGSAAGAHAEELPQQIRDASRPIAHSLAIPFDRMGRSSRTMPIRVSMTRRPTICDTWPVWDCCSRQTTPIPPSGTAASTSSACDFAFPKSSFRRSLFIARCWCPIA